MDPKNRVGGKGVNKEQNTSQIIRKDAKGCFVESLNDGFPIGKIHLTFATYDLSRPAGERQTMKGFPQPIISEILGHEAPESLNYYLSSDIEHLRTCALSIEEFPVAEEVFRV